MKSKRTVILIVLFLLIAATPVVFLQQTRRGLYFKDFSYLIESIEQEELDEFIEYCSDPNEDSFSYYNNEIRFPSDNAQDYCKIRIYTTIDNFSILNYMRCDSFIADFGENSRISFALPNSVADFIEPFSKSICIPIGTLCFYRAGMNEDDIQNYIKKLNLRLLFTNRFYDDVSYTIHLEKESVKRLSENPFS